MVTKSWLEASAREGMMPCPRPRRTLAMYSVRAPKADAIHTSTKLPWHSVLHVFYMNAQIKAAAVRSAGKLRTAEKYATTLEVRLHTHGRAVRMHAHLKHRKARTSAIRIVKRSFQIGNWKVQTIAFGVSFL